jgi:hypothetical protein
LGLAINRRALSANRRALSALHTAGLPTRLFGVAELSLSERARAHAHRFDLLGAAI